MTELPQSHLAQKGELQAAARPTAEMCPRTPTVTPAPARPAVPREEPALGVVSHFGGGAEMQRVSQEKQTMT